MRAPRSDRPVAQLTATSGTVEGALPRRTKPAELTSHNAAYVPIAPLNVGSETLFGQQLVDYSLNFIRVQPFAIPGFFTPAPLGCAERTVRVNLDSTALYVNGCSPQDVSKAVAAQSAVILSGQAKMVDREDNIEPSLRVANRRRMAHLLHSPWIHHILRKRCGD